MAWPHQQLGACSLERMHGSLSKTQAVALTSYMRLSGRPGTSGMTTAAVDVSGICCRVCAIALEAPAMTHARA